MTNNQDQFTLTLTFQKAPTHWLVSSKQLPCFCTGDTPLEALAQIPKIFPEMMEDWKGLQINHMEEGGTAQMYWTMKKLIGGMN